MNNCRDLNKMNINRFNQITNEAQGNTNINKHPLNQNSN